MPKKIPKELIEKWKELRKQGHSCEKIGEMTGGYSRRTVEKYTREPKEEKKEKELVMLKNDFSLYIEYAGELYQRKCPYANRVRDGYCGAAQFLADEWNLAIAGKIFPDFIIVKEREREYIRPKITPKFCFFCAPTKILERHAAELEKKLKGDWEKTHSDIHSRSSKLHEFVKEKTTMAVKESADIAESIARRVLGEVNDAAKRIREISININALEVKGRFKKGTCQYSVVDYCHMWSFNTAPEFAMRTIQSGDKLIIDPHPFWCAICEDYKVRGT